MFLSILNCSFATNFKGSIATGILNGKFYEMVYDDFVKLSQLDWDITSVPVLFGHLSWSSDYLSLSLQGYKSFQATESYMSDYDWTLPDKSILTNQSHHPNTTLNYVYGYDVNAKIWLKNKEFFRVGFLRLFK